MRLLSEFIGNPKPKLEGVPAVDLEGKKSRGVLIMDRGRATFDHKQQIVSEDEE